jgi:Uma2 family endonuclease
MPTLVMDPAPAEIDRLIERRRRLGLDHRDEMWEGVYRVNPPPSHEHQGVLQQLAELLGPLARDAGLDPLIQEFGLGDGKDDYRVPDGGLHRPGASGVWHPTAALVIEIVSPGDDTWQKLPFYAAHRVQELLILDPATRSIDWLALNPREAQTQVQTEQKDDYRPIEHSELIDLSVTELAERIDWPPAE